MKILIFHRVEYSKVKYHEVIDHKLHQVTYCTTQEMEAQIPIEIPRNLFIRFGSLNDSRDADRIVTYAIAEGFERVVALSEYDLMLAARVREALGLPGPKINDVIPVRDKVSMKELVNRAGIRVPQFCRIENIDHNAIPKWLNGRVVVKPVDGASSEGVKIISRNFLGHLDTLGNSKGRGIEVEEFVEGPILHFDGWIKNGKVAGVVASRYVGTCLEFIKGQPLGSYQVSENNPLVSEWSNQVLKALKITAGVFHLEAIETPSGFVFLELGHRTGGAAVAETFELRTGVSLYHADLKNQAGISWNTFIPFRGEKKFYSWFVYPAHTLNQPNGLVVGSAVLDESIETVRWHQQQPEKQLKGWPKLSYNWDCSPCAGILSSESPEILGANLSQIFKSIQVHDVKAEAS